MNDQAKKVLSDAMELSEFEREQLAELLLTSLPRLPKREQAEIEKAWADEAVSRAEALERGDLNAEDGASAVAELREELGTIRPIR
ncbi:MAG: addiction module protein [Polyangiales bacterium]